MMDVSGLLSKGCASECIVGIGVPDPVLRTTAARLLEKGCRVRLESYDSAGELVIALKNGRIDCAVRGTLPSTEVLAGLKDQFGLKTIARVALLADRMRKPFLLAPVGIDDGRTMEERLGLARQTQSYFSELGWRLTVGVLSKGRAEDAHRGEDIKSSLEEGELIARELADAGVDASHYTILIERAVAEKDMVLAPDGVAGNLIFRTLHLVGGCEAYGAPVVNLTRVFVDTSRAKADMSDAVMLAAGLAESMG
jgi:putative methanogen marker protein 4